MNSFAGRKSNKCSPDPSAEGRHPFFADVINSKRARVLLSRHEHPVQRHLCPTTLA